MKHLIFDIEGNGLGEILIDKKGNLIPEISKIHLLVLRSYPDGEVTVFRNNEDEDTISEGWQILQSARSVIGHNIIDYDLPALRRLYGGRESGRVFDTFIAACLLWPDVKNHPFGGNGVDDFAKKYGKTKVGKDITDWSKWTPEMEARCINDCLVQHLIFDEVKEKVKRFPVSIKLEHRVADICSAMKENGVTIDIDQAEDMIEQMEIEKARCNDKLQEMFPPIIEVMKTPQYYHIEGSIKDVHYPRKKDAPASIRSQLVAGPMRTKEHPFNPNSSHQIADRFKEKYGWEAPLTEAGNPTTGEDVLKGLRYPEAEILLRSSMAEKRLQHLTDWVRRARASRTPGRIHPSVKPLGTATSRASHQQPNQTACPKVQKFQGEVLKGYEGRYGWEMRSLWGPREGWLQVGGDASGLELRMLGHALARWDNGAYGKEVIEGDIHTLNQEAGELHTRDQAKTIIYAYLYGAGDAHIGELITEHQSLPVEMIQDYHKQCDKWVRAKPGRDRSKWLKSKGREFRDKFEKRTPALAHLTAWCKQCASERGFVPLLDGRHAPVRSEHSALNTYLQGNGAIVMKVAMCIDAKELEQRGWLGEKVQFMLWPHDEFQQESIPEIADHVGQLIVYSIVEAGNRLKLRVPLDGEYKVGKNWAECH